MLQHKKKISDVMIFRRILMRIPVFLYAYRNDEVCSLIRTYQTCGRLHLTPLRNSVKNLSILKNLPYIGCAAGSLLLFTVSRCGVYDCFTLSGTRVPTSIGSVLIIAEVCFYKSKLCMLYTFYTLCLARLGFTVFVFHIGLNCTLHTLVATRVSRISFLITSPRSESN